MDTNNQIIQNIKDNSEHLDDGSYRIYYYGKYIYFNFLLDKVQYKIGLQYDNDIFWENLLQIVTIEDFYNKFFLDLDKLETGMEYLSKKEIRKIKRIKIWNKDGIEISFDGNNFYFLDKSNIPSKEIKDDYSKFHDNMNAVFVEYWVPSHKSPHRDREGGKKFEWFEDIEAFKQFYNKLLKDYVPYFGTPYYFIKKVGYTGINPDNAKIYIRLPYYDVIKEYKNTKNQYTNENYIIYYMSKCWTNLCNIKDVKHYEYIREFIVENVIKKFLKYKENDLTNG